MANLYLLKFNNYYNRQIKRYSRIQDYADYMIDPAPLTGINFVPNDYVDTAQIINWTGDHPDYLLVEEDGTFSRWFVIETFRLRNGQLRLSLHRDVIADFYTDVIKAPCYIEKAKLAADDPFIFNSEKISFNQIKRAETLLKDKTKKAWIVGYISPKDDAGTLNKEYTAPDPALGAILTNYSDWKNWADNSFRIPIGITFRQDINLANPVNTYNFDVCRLSVYKGFFSTDSDSVSSYMTGTRRQEAFRLKSKNFTDADFAADVWYGQIRDNSNLLLSIQNDTGLSNFAVNPGEGKSSYSGRIVKDTNTNKYYEINVQRAERSIHKEYNFNSQIGNVIYNQLNSNTYLQRGDVVPTDASQPQTYFKFIEEVITLNEVQNIGYRVTVTSNKNLPIDAPYQIFAMEATNKDGERNYNNILLAIEMAKKMGDFLYDIQILPYCPVPQFFDEAGNVLTTLTEGEDYNNIRSGNDVVGKLFWANRSQITFDINYLIPVEMDPIEKKIKDQTELYRLCSPNGSGYFEFSAQKNNGIAFFNVDMSLRPVNPYIHINPNFGGLYGEDFNDFRGLILQGDFSLPTIVDQWVNYEINNKNYENIFSRGMQNMEVQHKYAEIQDIFGAISGTASGGVSGAVAGSAAGPWGAIAGAVVGTVAGAAGGIADVSMNRALRDEAKDYRRDLYNYSLQNIQALPEKITKTGCLTYNNKLVPYLEFYSATDEEKTALREKIKYNGMTVNRIGKIEDFITETETYIKAQLIRIEFTEGEDFHLANVIAAELYKGVFL